MLSCRMLIAAQQTVGLKRYMVEDAFGYWLHACDLHHINESRFRCLLLFRQTEYHANMRVLLVHPTQYHANIRALRHEILTPAGCERSRTCAEGC